jgi:hypothetical protein
MLQYFYCTVSTVVVVVVLGNSEFKSLRFIEWNPKNGIWEIMSCGALSSLLAAGGGDHDDGADSNESIAGRVVYAAIIARILSSYDHHVISRGSFTSFGGCVAC